MISLPQKIPFWRFQLNCNSRNCWRTVFISAGMLKGARACQTGSHANLCCQTCHCCMFTSLYRSQVWHSSSWQTGCSGSETQTWLGEDECSTLCCRGKQGENEELDEERRIAPIRKVALRMIRPVWAPFNLIDCGVLQLLRQHEA